MTISTIADAPPDIARAVIDPAAYAAWDPLLDQFDWLREHLPVARIVSSEPENSTGWHEPFWLITRYDDVMQISKDNKTFLNNPRPVVFTTKVGEDFARVVTAKTGESSHNLVESLVVFDAPLHMLYRKLTQEWFMPKSLARIEAQIRELAHERVAALLAAGEGGPGGSKDVDFVKLVSAPYPLHVVMQILGVPEEDEPRMLMLTQQLFGGQDEDLNQSGIKNLSPEAVTPAGRRGGRRFRSLFRAADRRSPCQSDR